MQESERVQTRLEQWEGAEYPDKRPRASTVETIDTGRDTGGLLALFLFLSFHAAAIYWTLTAL